MSGQRWPDAIPTLLAQIVVDSGLLLAWMPAGGVPSSAPETGLSSQFYFLNPSFHHCLAARPHRPYVPSKYLSFPEVETPPGQPQKATQWHRQGSGVTRGSESKHGGPSSSHDFFNCFQIWERNWWIYTPCSIIYRLVCKHTTSHWVWKGVFSTL